MSRQFVEVNSRDLESVWRQDSPPVIAVTLAQLERSEAALDLPPCPVIGIGDSRTDFAKSLDVVVRDGESAEPLIASISAHPHAAAVLVQTLRATWALPVRSALFAESLAYGVLQGGAEHSAWLDGRAVVLPGKAGKIEVSRTGNRLNICMARPEVLNAIAAPMRDGLREAFELGVIDTDIDEIVLTGAGGSFCAGADLSEFGTARDPALAHMIRMQTLPAHAIAACAGKLTARVHGACIGAGLEMAAFARRIEAHHDSFFQLPELKMGLIPGAGGCVSVTRRIGRQRAAWMVLSGERVDAAKALDWGLVDTLVD